MSGKKQTEKKLPSAPPSYNPSSSTSTSSILGYQPIKGKDVKDQKNKDGWQPAIWNGEPVNREFNLFNWDSLQNNIKNNPYLWGASASGVVAMGLSVNYALKSKEFVAAVGATAVLVAVIGFLAKHLHDKAMQYKSENVVLENELETLWKETQKYFNYDKADDSNRYNAFKPKPGDFSKSKSITMVGGIASLTAGAVGLTANQYAPELVVPYGWCMFTAVVAGSFLLLNRFARYCQEKHYYEQLDRQVTALRQLKANLAELSGEKALDNSQQVLLSAQEGHESTMQFEDKSQIAAKGFSKAEEWKAKKAEIFDRVALNAYEKVLVVGGNEKDSTTADTNEKERLKTFDWGAFNQGRGAKADDVGNGSSYSDEFAPQGASM